MEQLTLKRNPAVEQVFDQYPSLPKEKILALRGLILEAAHEIEGLSSIEETLKWGEPSYLTKHGSTIRIDWKARQPDQYAMYFSCTSRLVPTFRRLFGEVFSFEGNRALVFHVEDDVQREELTRCIKAALMYHKVKHLPNLGI